MLAVISERALGILSDAERKSVAAADSSSCHILTQPARTAVPIQGKEAEQ